MAFITLNHAKAVVASSMYAVGANALQLASAFDALDALPKFTAVPMTFPSGPSMQHESSVDSDDDGKVDERSIPVKAGAHKVRPKSSSRLWPSFYKNWKLSLWQ